MILVIIVSTGGYAQFGMRRGYGRQMGPSRSPQQRRMPRQNFKPSVDLAVGYGFPNEDQQQLPEFQNLYKGSVSQSGPITGSLNYRFSQGMSIGILATHGKVSVPYYDNFGPVTAGPVLNGMLENTAVMLNIVRYMPGGPALTPYVRTAIGVNIWQQTFTDAFGNKVDPGPLPDLAYQVGIGAKINMSKNSSFFIEAGYGKYILHVGLSLKL
jgi:hypothetical protein